MENEIEKCTQIIVEELSSDWLPHPNEQCLISAEFNNSVMEMSYIQDLSWTKLQNFSFSNFFSFFFLIPNCENNLLEIWWMKGNRIDKKDIKNK